MELTYFLGRAWDFILWFANLVLGTVANSIFGGWNAVLILAAVVVVLFILTRAAKRPHADD
jgi:hypothetical protein